MFLHDAIRHWSDSEGETTLLDSLPSLVAELNLLRDLDFIEKVEDDLWCLVDQLDSCGWGNSASEAFIEFAMDASLLLGSEDLFTEFFSWLESRSEQLSRHKAAKLWLESIRSYEQLEGRIPDTVKLMEQSLGSDVDLKWNSLSLLIMMDVAQKGMAMSPQLPSLLTEQLKPLFTQCQLPWVLDDLTALNPNETGWLDARNVLLSPLYKGLIGEVESSGTEAVSTEYDCWKEHLNVFDAEGRTMSLGHIVNEAKGVYRRMPEANAVWASLARGTAIITDANQLDAYLASYGSKHIAKLKCVLESSFGSSIPVRIVDWSCGQGLGTLSALGSVWNMAHLEEVVLIEPSRIALNRAANLVACHGVWSMRGAPKVIQLNGFLVRDTMLGRTFDGPTLHIFSNVLDMEEVDLDELADLIQSSFTGEQMVIATSPFISRMRSMRLLAFQERFSSYEGFSIHRAIERDYIGGNASITARLFSFSV